MNNTQNITIVLLLISAVVLTAVLIGAYTGTSETAYADGSTRSGDYTMVTGAYDKEFDLLYVINIAKKTLIVYRLNNGTKAIDLQDKIDLGRAFR